MNNEEDTLPIGTALQWAKEISKLPNESFTISFFPYSRKKGLASSSLVTKEGCTHRAQLPRDKFSIDSDNFFLFKDSDGKECMCYKVLIRYMGFPQDKYKLHKISWYE